MKNSIPKSLVPKEGPDLPPADSVKGLPFDQDAPDGPAAPDTLPIADAAPAADGDGSARAPETEATGAAAPDPDRFDLGAIIDAKRALLHSEEGPNLDPFDLQSLRLSQDFASAAGIRKPLVFVPVRKPHKEAFIRTHPDDSCRLQTVLLELQAEQEVYLVAPKLWAELASESTVSPRLLVLAVDRQGVVFLWMLRLPGPDGKIDDWSRSALDAASMARTEWVRITANMRLGAYDIAVASFHAEPAWPDLSFQDILKIAFRDKMISSWDHPVLRRLRGEI